MSTAKPNTVCGDLHHLPAALAPLVALPNWVLWRWEMVKNAKGEINWTKVPYQPNGKKARNNAPTTWSSYDTVMRVVEKFDGIGFMLLNTDIAAFDLDKCRDPDSGTLDPWAGDKVKQVGSYTEVTVSGTGLRIIGRGHGQPIHRKLPVHNGVSCEVYRRCERYIVMTGNPLSNAQQQLGDIDTHIDATVATLGAKKARGEQNKPGTPDDGGQHARQAPPDEDVLEKVIRDGESGLFGGDRSKAVWFVINEMLRRGYQPPVILATLLDRDNGISAHIYDQHRPRQYAERQVTDAVAQITFTFDEKRIIFRTPANICIALLKMGVSFRYDRFADRTLIDGLANFGPTLDDAAVNRIWMLMGQRFQFRPPQTLVHSVVADAARLNGFHPVRDYLTSLRWDGKSRLDRWLTTYGGAEDTEYTRAVGALMLIAAVRRVRQPGCKFDEMLVLVNPVQGTDKSTALSTLATREDWFADDMPLNIAGKQVIECLRGRWIVECAELAGMRRADIEHVRAQLSRQIDRARMAYDRVVSEVPRQCVFFGTTNSVEFLGDTSGNRRFWPVSVDTFDVAALRRDRDQLWAEAAARETEGESIRLHPKLWPVAAEEQAKRLTPDPWFDALQAELEDKAGKISMESLWTIVNMPGGQRGQLHSRRVGEAMRKLGWERPPNSTVRIDGKLTSGFVRGEKPWRTVTARRSKEDGLLVVCYDDVV